MKIYETEDSDDDGEEEEIPGLPSEIVVGNRAHRRRRGVRSSYKERLKEMQRREGDDGDRT